MSITQTSLKSKNYQALGIDEIADDITNIITVVNALEYTETIVNITSAQILAMDSTPIELLPVPAAGTYYDSVIIKLEFYPGNVNFVSAETKFYTLNGSNSYELSLGALKDGYEAYWVVDCNQADVIFSTGAEGTTSRMGFTENYPAYSQIGLFCAGNIATGNGTGKATIIYTVRTFGA